MTTAALTTLVAHDCPDCHSETRIVHLGDNIHVVQIFHDDTCPTLAKIDANHE